MHQLVLYLEVPLYIYMYRCTWSYIVGGIAEFGVLHPSLCEVSVSPLQRSFSTGPRATTPGNDTPTTCSHIHEQGSFQGRGARGAPSPWNCLVPGPLKINMINQTSRQLKQSKSTRLRKSFFQRKIGCLRWDSNPQHSAL